MFVYTRYVVISCVSMSTFIESMLNCKIPDPPANGEITESFVRSVILEILSDHSVLEDIDKRVRSGSGVARIGSHHKCADGCSHANHDMDDLLRTHTNHDVDDLTRLIGQITREISIHVMQKIVERATDSFSSVLARGKAAGAPALDSNTSGFLRRKILTQSIVQTIVIEVGIEYSKLAKNAAKNGQFFAIFSSLPEEKRFQCENLIQPIHMSALMNEGVANVFNFAPILIIKDLQKELERIDALGNFDNNVFWTSFFEPKIYPQMSILSEQIRLIPFALNFFDKQLFLQQVGHFQISKNEPIVRECKIACIYSPGRPLLLIDPCKHANLPHGDYGKFQISAFLTGPS